MTLTLTIWPLQAELIPITALTSRLQPELSPPPQDPWTPMKDLLLQILCKVEFCLLQAAFCDLFGFYCPLRSPCRLAFWNPFIPLAHSPVGQLTGCWLGQRDAWALGSPPQAG